jgi:hypothetical protein
LPLSAARGTPWDGTDFMMPAPMDDPSFMPCGTPEHTMHHGEDGTGTEGKVRAKPAPLPGASGQFGRDISTEEYEPLNEATVGTGRRDR